MTNELVKLKTEELLDTITHITCSGIGMWYWNEVETE